MAKVRKKPKAARPLLMAAFFCENILEEKEGVLTAVRIVDVLKVRIPDLSGIPEGQPKPTIATQIKALLGFKSGEAKGKRTVHLTVVAPSGKRRKTVPTTVTFMGNELGVNIRAQVVVEAEEEGLYWYEVRVDGKLLTRMPLRIVHEKPTSDDERSKRSEGSDGTA